MLDGHSPLWQHVLQNVALLALSLAFLPLDTLVLVMAKLIYERDASRTIRGGRCDAQRTVLVTGVGMTKGLALARLFAAAGDCVIGADFSPLACGRFSNSLTRFHTLQKPSAGSKSSAYVDSLMSVIRREKVDLWVSCSGVASALEDGMAKEAVEATTDCKAVQYDVATTKVLHEKSSFIDHVSKLGLTVPETHTVTDRGEIEQVLTRAQKSGRRFICKCVGMDDASRGDMAVLPLSSESETLAHIRRLNVSERNPFIVQQYISGVEYCTHALVIRGQVKAFVACPSSDLLMHYVALSSKSPLSQAMLRFTQVVARAGGETFTGHLSFDFLVENADLQKDANQLTLYPIECNPRAHTAVALFENAFDMVQAYHTLVDLETVCDQEVVYPRMPHKYYWIAHDLVCLLLLPCLALIQKRTNAEVALRGIRTLFEHLQSWKDGTFKWNDPTPWWWLYHVYWPAQLLSSVLQGQKWSRLNVSTTKMFTC